MVSISGSPMSTISVDSKNLLSAMTVSTNVPKNLIAGGTGDNYQQITDAILKVKSGGIVYVPFGIYSLSSYCLELINVKNVSLSGAGIDKTVIVVSSNGLSRPGGTDGSYGIITIVGGENVSISDMTIVCQPDSTNLYLKGIYIKDANGVTVSNVKIVDSAHEAIYAEGVSPRKNTVIDSCQITGHKMTAIDINTVHGDSQRVTNNYISNGGGISVRGKATIVSGNIMRNCHGVGIGLYSEHADVYHNDAIVSNNVISGVSAGDSLIAHGIFVNSEFSAGDGGVLISSNVISDVESSSGKTARGISVIGNAKVVNNIISGTVNGDIGTSVAISVSGTDTPDVSGNTIESALENSSRWQFGIHCSTTAGATISNNTVYRNSIISDGGIAFRDLTGKSRLFGNVFNGPVDYGNSAFNSNGTLDNSMLVTDLSIGTVTGTNRIPMVANVVQFTKYYIAWNTTAIEPGSFAYGDAPIQGAEVGDVVSVSYAGENTVPPGVLFYSNVVSSNLCRITCVNQSSANFKPDSTSGKYKLCVFR